EDDRLVDLLNAEVVPVHRGSVHDVLRRVVDAVEPFGASTVLRQTADNPYPDPEVMATQLRRLEAGPFDYVGIAGLPLGIGGEAVRWEALVTADREAVDPADREHVLPFVYRHPERFRIGALEEVPTAAHRRYTVDTPADLALARAIAERLGGGVHWPPRLADLEAILAAEPDLAALNAGVEQRGHDTSQIRGTVTRSDGIGETRDPEET
ncbi:MAG TPA: hypothetical protein VFP22_01760, partial [Candidatus Limnocylindrales bacterium]|nr:hypothetical protein [Candidatus Limnocylindrales bacterium]